MYSVQAESIIKDYETFTAPIDEFLASLDIKIISKTENTLEFDILNCHPSIANAIRRALISMVPSMAIHNVSIYENTTVFPDEYIAHRLGLIPIEVNPQNFNYFKDQESFDNVLNFKIHKKNTSNEIIYLTSNDIEFVPIDYQENMEVKVKKDVLICKMAPKHEIEMTFKAIKGTGEQHAKWSPVSLCSYRVMPKIILERDFYNEEAEELKSCFSPGVIEIVDGRAVVANPRLESMSREIFRHDNLKDSVKILRESGWFCFTVESLYIDPIVLLKMAINELISACKNLKEEVTVVAENCRD